MITTAALIVALVAVWTSIQMYRRNRELERTWRDIDQRIQTLADAEHIYECDGINCPDRPHDHYPGRIP